MIVRSFGQLQRVTPTTTAGTPAGLERRWTAFDQLGAETYASIYRTQTNVRTVVDFLARHAEEG